MNAYIVVGPTKAQPRRRSSRAIACDSGDVVAKALVVLARSYLERSPNDMAGETVELPMTGWRRLFAEVTSR